ncbi:GD16398 [Drosophila simulans]|uniref:GD16398 n=1 Tax=Drosophila simulans TaxID=7240 RepID=B4R331_DROSI|nr:GD16398 [Drosophila simulans]
MPRPHAYRRARNRGSGDTDVSAISQEMDEMPSRFSSTSPDSEDSREQSTSTASTEEDESPYRQSLRREKSILASSPLSME